jgi:hypothetical protein
MPPQAKAFSAVSRSALLAVAGALCAGAPTLLAAEGTSGAVVTKIFSADAVRKLVVDSESGKLTIRGGARQAVVHARKLHFGDACVLAIDLKDGALTATAKQPDEREIRGGHDACEVELTIDVPRDVALDLALGAGDVAIDGVKGDLTYRLGSGDLRVGDAELGTLDGRSGSGDVDLVGSVVTGDLKLGAGDADITFPAPPAPGRLDVRVGTGNATIKLPKDARIRSNFKAGLGSLTNELGDSPEAKFTISGTAGAGDMTIRRF